MHFPMKKCDASGLSHPKSKTIRVCFWRFRQGQVKKNVSGSAESRHGPDRGSVLCFINQASKTPYLIVIHHIKENDFVGSNAQDQPPTQIQPRLPIVASMEPAKAESRMLMGIGQKTGKGEDHVDNLVPKLGIERPPGG